MPPLNMSMYSCQRIGIINFLPVFSQIYPSPTIGDTHYTCISWGDPVFINVIFNLFFHIPYIKLTILLSKRLLILHSVFLLSVITVLIFGGLILGFIT